MALWPDCSLDPVGGGKPAWLGSSSCSWLSSARYQGSTPGQATSTQDKFDPLPLSEPALSEQGDWKELEFLSIGLLFSDGGTGRQEVR